MRLFEHLAKAYEIVAKKVEDGSPGHIYLVLQIVSGNLHWPMMTVK
jgi:hypothetical protein